VGKSIVYSLSASVFFGSISAGITMAILGLIAALTKSSCPFIYVNNGNEFVLTGEIYSGTVFPQLERHDYLSLPQIKSVDGDYRIKISNEANEIQHTNFLELMVYDHPDKCEVLVDKYGNVHTLSNLQLPFEARNSVNGNILPEVYKRDSISYLPDISAESILMENIAMKFEVPDKSNAAKLVIRAKNNLWLDYAYGEFYDLFGDDFPRWYNRQTKRSADRLRTWSLDQGIPMSVYIEKEGGWEFVDYFNVAGPIALKDDVLLLDLTDIESDFVKIKLEYGYLFWEIDYVAMDFTQNVEVEKYIVPLWSAIDRSGENVIELLNNDDSLYYTQPFIGDEAVLTFKMPEIFDSTKRSVILHSKGYYEILRYPQGKRDIAHFNSYWRPGWFVEFSKERFELKREGFEARN